MEPAGRDFHAEYELLGEIGRGGMGVIYKAHQPRLNRVVAIKVIHAAALAGEAARRRFEAEMQTAGRLNHPNIVRVFDTGEMDGSPCFAMEYLAGDSLAARLKDFTAAPEAGVRLLVKVARAVSFAHQRGVLHRDLKPANILLDEAGEPHVADFGLAKQLDSDSDMTRSGAVLGSPNYMSPEQAAGKSESLTVATDIYSLGVTLYEMLTGRTPFVADTPLETMRLVVEMEAQRPSTMVAKVNRDLETICLKCLRKEPEQRYHTAEELADDLERCLRHEPIQARPVTGVERLQMWARRRPALAGTSVLLLLALLGGVTGVSWQWRQAEKARRAAEIARQHADSLRQHSDALRTQAEAARRTAEEQARAERLRAYASDISLAQHALANDNRGRALELLDQQRPAAGQTDLRGWEWRYLWQQCQSEALRVVSRDQGNVAGLEYSPDGKWLAVLSSDGTRLSLWNATNYTRHFPVTNSSARMYAAFSPVEPLLAVAMQQVRRDGAAEFEVLFWNTATRQFVHRWAINGSCRGLAFSSDGQRLLTASRSSMPELAVWKVATGTLISRHVTVSMSGAIGTPFAASRDLRYAAVAPAIDEVRVYEPETGRELARVNAGGSTATAVAFSPDGSVLAVGLMDGADSIHLVSLPEGKPVGRLRGHRGYVFSMLFSRDGRTLISSASDQTIRRWDLSEMRATGVLRGHQNEVWQIALSPGEERLASGAAGGELMLWDMAGEWGERARLVLPPSRRFTWCFTPDSQGILVAGAGGRVARHALANLSQEEILLEAGAGQHDMQFSSDGRHVAAGTTNGLLRVWSLPEAKLLGEIKTGKSLPAIWNISKDGRRLRVVHGQDQSLLEWDLPAGTSSPPAMNLAGWRSLESFPRGRFRRFVARDVLAHWGKMDSAPFQMAELTNVFSGVYSADERLFATPGRAGRVTLSDLGTGHTRTTARAFLQGMHSYAISPTGRLAVGSDNREALKLWDVESMHELVTLSAEGSAFSQTFFSPDGNCLGSMNGLGSIRIWRAPTWREIDETVQVR